MRLVCAKYGLNLTLMENQVNVLVVESPAVLSDILGNLKKQEEGQEGIFLLSHNDKILQFEKKVQVIVNPFSLTYNERKITNKLYAQLESVAVDFYEQKEAIHAKLMQLLDEIISVTPYGNIVYNLNYEWQDIWKGFHVGFEEPAGTLVEKLIEYIKILSLLSDIEIVCMMNLKAFLTAEEIRELYKTAFYNKIYLLLIESSERECIEDEKIMVIDKDMCLIIK